MVNQMSCEIYKSAKKTETYLYFSKPANFELVPEIMRKSLGKLEFVMTLDLGPTKKLARDDVITVMNNITNQGFHVQLPPSEKSLLAVHNPNVSGSAWDK